MNDRQWQQVKEVFDSALNSPPDQRPMYVQRACGGDPEVSAEVEKLLRSFDDNFMTEPAIAEVARNGAAGQLGPGDIIGHYRVRQRLGAGGMGEVYLAEDTKLDRLAAIKILPPDSAFDPSARKRLIREAKAAAALDHPNIGTIYEVGEADGYTFIVMQYLRGETLAERVSRGRLPVPEAVSIAIQIADALCEAHSRDVVHRDIKPANIIIDSQRKVKVLDFSLAKRTVVSETDVTESIFSKPGMIFGTVAYMSPEQARGRPIDSRTDIWSFGVVLYEMLTGRHPFLGSSTSDTLAAILKSEPPPIEQEGVKVPARLEMILQKALEKNAEDRYQTIEHLLRDLRDVSVEEMPGAATDITAADAHRSTTQRLRVGTGEMSGPAGFYDSGRSTVNLRRPAAWAASAAAMVIVVAGIWIGARYIAGTRSVSELIVPTAAQVFEWKRDLEENLGSAARFSPDGRFIAFVSTREGESAIWMKPVGGGAAYTLRKDPWIESSPVFSPDSEEIAFLSKRGNETGIWTMSARGGPPELLQVVDDNILELVRWSADRRVIYYASQNILFGLDIATKQTARVLDLGGPPSSWVTYAISPDESSIAYIATQDGRKDIWVVSRSGGEPVRITNDEFPEGDLVWHPDGKRIVYDAVRKDISQLYVARTDGTPPTPLLPSASDNYVSDVSHDGRRILYFTPRDEGDLWRADIETSEESRLTDALSIEMWAEPSPDGRAFAYQEIRTGDISRRVAGTAIITQTVTGEKQSNEIVNDGFLARWSPDGNRIAFYRSAGGMANIWTVSSAGGRALQLTMDGVTVAGYSRFPIYKLQTNDYQWSPDSVSLYYCARRNNTSNLYHVGAGGGPEMKLTDISDPQVWLYSPFLSPDGTKIAYLRLDRPDDQPNKKKWSIWLIEGGETKMLYRSDSVLGILGWSGSGNELYVESTVGKNADTFYPSTIDILEVSIASESVRPLQRIESGYPKSFVISPDRASIVFATRSGNVDSLKIAPVRGGDPKTIVKSNDERVYFASPSWTSDGKSIIFGKQSNWQIISMVDNFQ